MRLHDIHRITHNVSLVLAFAIAGLLPAFHAVATDVDLPKVFSGTLRDDTGNPVAGARITAKNVGPLHCGNVQVRSSEATTDEDGRFSLRTGFLPVCIFFQSEKGTLYYPHNPYYPGQKLPLGLLRRSEHNLTLMRWAKVSGHVVEQKTGSPVGRFRIHYHSPTTHAPRSYQSKDGRFAEARVTPGTQTISIMTEGYAPSIIHAVRVAPGSSIDIGTVRMASGPTLAGRVVSAKDGRPVEGAVIRFRDARTHTVVAHPPDQLTATSDADGRFTVKNMPFLALEVFTSIEKPSHRTLTIGKVDMSLAGKDAVEATFFLDAEG